MMKRAIKVTLLSTFLFAASSGLTSCGKSSPLTLRILNSEDYIYINEDDPTALPDMVEQFKAYVRKNYPQYAGVDVVYNTSDTNETIYSEIQTGKSNYDLINVSEYMAQKIVTGNFAVPLYRHNGASYEDPADYDKISNYQQFASPTIKNRLDRMVATPRVPNEEGVYVEVERPLKDYAVGYMWGTLGILFNPTYSVFQSRGIDADTVMRDLQVYDSLWSVDGISKYDGTISIKNSMRDTYAIGLFYAFRDDFKAYYEAYEEVKEDPTSTEEEIAEALAIYQAKFEQLFNSSDQATVNAVADALAELKKHIFGLEVDSGKEDIITQKIGINVAWSGDAVFSMDQADEKGTTLYYSIPKYGSNIWSDVWVMPNCARSDQQYELAHIFLDFLSDPYYAAQNMDYTGYTSFVGGDDILELVRDYYDMRTDEIYEEVEGEYYSVYAVDEVAEEIYAIDYPDFYKDLHDPEIATHDDAKDPLPLYYFIPYVNEDEEEIDEPADYADLMAEGHNDIVPFRDEEGEVVYDSIGGEDVIRQKLYGNLTIVDETDEYAVDLTYFFKDTLYTTAADKYGDELAEMDLDDIVLYEDRDMVFYTTEYFVQEDNYSVGRQFFCQYPDQDTINRCAIMKDYGTNNEFVLKMWENFKSDPLPVWAIVTFAVIGAGVLGLSGYFIYNASMKKHLRKKRKKVEE